MDLKKRRLVDEENGSECVLAPEDVRKILESFTKEQLIDILQSATLRHGELLESIRSVSDSDPSIRKLFIRGLSPETTSDTLRSYFISYGDVEEAIVIFDKNTAKSKGFGFVTFKHVDGAVLALKCPSKIIDGRMTVTQLASVGVSSNSSSDVLMRKIYVGNVPFEISSERLLEFFMSFGEVEEGPLGFDKSSGKPWGFAFFIFKTEDGARAAVAEPMKVVDGHQILCKMAVDNKKVKGAGSGVGAPPAMESQTQFGYTGMVGSYGGSASIASATGVGSGGYGAYQYSIGTGDYRMGSNPVGMGLAGYPNGGPYGHPQQISAAPLPPRGPPSGMYQGMPPYY